MNQDLTHVEYEMCGKPNCWFFIDKNDADPVPGVEIAEYIHLCSGEYEANDPDADHNAIPSGDIRTLGIWAINHPELFREFGDELIGPNSPHFTPRSADHPKLETLTGWVEYDINAPGHPDHFVARAEISGGVEYPAPEDYIYPSPYRSAWNSEGRIMISVTQHALDVGNMWPAGTREVTEDPDEAASSG